ncbi:MAG: hypothetical protein R6T96_09385 [Longimicrobiales bacterium]
MPRESLEAPYLPRPVRLSALSLLALALTGCHISNFPGPQLQEPPPGFFREADAGQERRMFPQRELLHHDVWVNASWGDVTTIHINGHPGRVMRADVRDALESARAEAEPAVVFGGVEEQIIDGRPAWGWTERLETEKLGISWIGYRVAIPYDTITYTVELRSGDPALKQNPDTLKAIAGTFAVGKTTWNVPLIVAVTVLLVILVQVTRKRRRERSLRMESITLQRVQRKKAEDDGESFSGARPEEDEKNGIPDGKNGISDKI